MICVRAVVERNIKSAAGNNSMNFEKASNKIESEKKFEPNFELGSFNDIESSINFLAIKKTIENQWGNEQDKTIAAEIKNQKIELDPELISTYHDIKELANNNEETLNWLSFVVDKDESLKSEIVNQIVKHKGLSEDGAKNLLTIFSDFYQAAKNGIDLTEIKDFVSSDLEEREDDFSELKNRNQEAIDFFNPKSSTIKDVVYLPTNPLEQKQTGNGIEVGEKFYINSEKGNEINQIHEFLHLIVNPIIAELNLSEEDKKRILELCPNRLKDYEYPESILTEEIIRTYKTGFKEENKPGVDNFKEFLVDDAAWEHYYKNIRDVFSEEVWNFFEEYQKSKVDNFKEYLLNNYRDILKEKK